MVKVRVGLLKLRIVVLDMQQPMQKKGKGIMKHMSRQEGVSYRVEAGEELGR